MTEDPFAHIPDAPHTPNPKEDVETWPGDREEILGKQKGKAFTNHGPRTIKYYEERGWTIVKVESRKSVGYGSTVKIDFLGLFDYLAFKRGEQDIAIQVGAEAAFASHLSKMTSTQWTTFNNARRIDNLIMWLETGHRAVYLGWKKEGARWVPTEHEITHEYAMKALARKKAK